MLQTALAENIRVEMARKRKSQTELGELLGITRQAVSRRLLGRVDFRVSEIEAIASFLDVPVASLIGEAA